MSSPRTWGCFFAGPQRGRGWGVFPTHVGVFPFDLRTIFQRLCLPHARGGVSNPGLIQFFNQPSSPRTWGCFQTSSSTSTALQVFPTHVGVFLSPGLAGAGLYRLPHARGGVSTSYRKGIASKLSSPRTWGCFYCSRQVSYDLVVFPTHVGVFLILNGSMIEPVSLPHARGGVSQPSAKHIARPWSSPRTWGCFLARRCGLITASVFPTHVGVFPKRGSVTSCATSLPYACGA